MKTLHLTIIVIAFSMLILNWAQVEGRIVPQTIMQLYKESDIILVGNVTSAEITSSGIHTFYHIKVEQYLKGPPQSNTITVVGSGPNGGHPPPDPKFMVGDRVRLYLYEEDGMHMIGMYSTKANPKCYAHELLGLGPRELVPREGHDPKYSEINCGPPYANLYPNTASFLPPTIQFKSGIAAEDVVCKEDLQLIMKAKDGSPACVKNETIRKLVVRGWGVAENWIKLENFNDAIRYEIDGGKILSISAYSAYTNPSQPGETKSTTLIIMLDAKVKGQLSITMPRDLIDAKIYADDDSFFVLLNQTETQYDETKTTFDRTLKFAIPPGINEIEIIGYGYYNDKLPFPPAH